MLGRTTTLVVVLQIIASLKIFDQIYLITAGGPNYATRSAIEYIYDTGFTSQRVGYASAASLVLFVVILVVSFVWLALIQQAREGLTDGHQSAAAPDGPGSRCFCFRRAEGSGRRRRTGGRACSAGR